MVKDQPSVLITEEYNLIKIFHYELHISIFLPLVLHLCYMGGKGLLHGRSRYLTGALHGCYMNVIKGEYSRVTVVLNGSYRGI